MSHTKDVLALAEELEQPDRIFDLVDIGKGLAARLRAMVAGWGQEEPLREALAVARNYIRDVGHTDACDILTTYGEMGCSCGFREKVFAQIDAALSREALPAKPVCTCKPGYPYSDDCPAHGELPVQPAEHPLTCSCPECNAHDQAARRAAERELEEWKSLNKENWMEDRQAVVKERDALTARCAALRSELSLPAPQTTRWRRVIPVEKSDCYCPCCGGAVVPVEEAKP